MANIINDNNGTTTVYVEDKRYTELLQEIAKLRERIAKLEKPAPLPRILDELEHTENVSNPTTLSYQQRERIAFASWWCEEQVCLMKDRYEAMNEKFDTVTMADDLFKLHFPDLAKLIGMNLLLYQKGNNERQVIRLRKTDKKY